MEQGPRESCSWGSSVQERSWKFRKTGPCLQTLNIQGLLQKQDYSQSPRISPYTTSPLCSRNFPLGKLQALAQMLSSARPSIFRLWLRGKSVDPNKCEWQSEPSEGAGTGELYPSRNPGLASPLLQEGKILLKGILQETDPACQEWPQLCRRMKTLPSEAGEGLGWIPREAGNPWKCPRLDRAWNTLGGTG